MTSTEATVEVSETEPESDTDIVKDTATKLDKMFVRVCASDSIAQQVVNNLRTSTVFVDGQKLFSAGTYQKQQDQGGSGRCPAS